MRRFQLHRDEDLTGVSGTGTVAEGVEFSDGTVVFTWIIGRHKTLVSVPGGIESVVAVHGHQGSTRVIWLDPSAIPILHLAVVTCRHCGNAGPPSENHNCPCPFSDESCRMHP